MATVIELYPNEKHGLQTDTSERFKRLLEKRKKGTKEPLTPQLLRKRPGLEGLSEEEATQLIQTIKDLAKVFFEIACRTDAGRIDNQHVVYSEQVKNAA